MNPRIVIWVGVPLLLLLVMSGCAHSPTANPYTQGNEQARDPTRSRELAAQAKSVAGKDNQAAESLLRQALQADLFNGPAHNNLGVLLLAQDRLYEAAEEFEWAKKLMPGHPDPRVNLAMTLERAGRTDEALASYDAATVLYQNYLPALQGRARLKIATGRSDTSTVNDLNEIALRGDPQWREWAELWAIKIANAERSSAQTGE